MHRINTHTYSHTHNYSDIYNYTCDKIVPQQINLPSRLWHTEPALHKALGLTLIELLIALSILSILTITAVPSFRYWQAKSESYTITAIIYQHLQTARQHAITQNKTVSFCGANNLGECKLRDFEQLQIFIDDNGNKKLDNQEELLTQYTLRLQGALSLNSHTAIKYKHNGSSATPASFIYCPKVDAPQLIQRITLSMPGRVYVAPPAPGGIVRKTSGGDITC